MKYQWQASYSLNQSGLSLIETMVGLIIISVMGIALSTMMIGANRQAKQNALKVDSISLINEVTALLSDPEVCKVNFAGKAFASIPEASLTQIVNRDGLPFFKVFNPAAKEYSGISKFKILGMSIDQTKGGADAANKTTTLVVRIATEKLSSAESDDPKNRELVQMIRLSYTGAGPNIVSCRSVGGITDLWTRKLTAGAYNDVFYAGGNVGIGTNNPLDRLTVFGDGTTSGLMISGAASKPFVLYNTTGAVDQLRIRTQNYDGTGQVDVLNINSTNGYVGFGVSDPNYPLDVKSDNSAIGSNMILRESGHAGGSKRASIVLGNDWSVGQDAAGTGTRDFFVWQGGTTNKFRLNIDPSGKVGIGTTAPIAALDVQGGIKLGTETVCDATREGTVRYSTTVKNAQVCDGTQWITMVDPVKMCAKMGGTWDATAEKCAGAYGDGPPCKGAAPSPGPGAAFGMGGAATCFKRLDPPLAMATIPEAERSQYLWTAAGVAYSAWLAASSVATAKIVMAAGGADVDSGVICKISGKTPVGMPGGATCGGATYYCASGNMIPVYEPACPGVEIGGAGEGAGGGAEGGDGG